MDPQILFHSRELADTYALKTLHDYLVEEDYSHQTGFIGSINSERQRDVLKGTLEGRIDVKNKLIISCYSDISTKTFPNNTPVLDIDIALLKNAVKPVTEKQKQQLKDFYGVPSSEPVFVIGRANNSEKVKRLVQETLPHAHVYLVGNSKEQDFDLPEYLMEKVHFVNKYGILRDYFAMADVSVDTSELVEHSHTPHNLIEMTEGGPLFRISTGTVPQYGYKELSELGVIQECTSLDEIVERVKSTLKGEVTFPEHTLRRNQHLEKTRSQYISTVVKYMDALIQGEPLPESNLKIETRGSITRIWHPDSIWDGGYDHKQIKITKDQYNIDLFKYDHQPSLLDLFTDNSYLSIKKSPFEKEIKSLKDYSSLSSLFDDEYLKPSKKPFFEKYNIINPKIEEIVIKDDYSKKIINEFSFKKETLRKSYLSDLSRFPSLISNV